MPFQRSSLRFALLAFSLSLFTACGGSRLEGGDDPFFSALSEEDARKLLDQSEVHCASPSECPSGVGLVTSLVMAQPTESGSSPGVGICTGFLVAPDVVATNSHCIPLDIKRHVAPADCGLRMRFTLPDGQHADCQSLLFASKIHEEDEADAGGVRPDFAFFRLASSMNAQTFTLDHEGSRQGDAVKILKVNPTSSSYPWGELKPQVCRNIQEGLALPKVASAKSSLVTMTDCYLREGNSGSPIVAVGNERNVKAVVFAYLTDRIQNRIESYFDVRLPQLSIGTNFACVSSWDAAQPWVTGPDCFEQTQVLEGTDEIVARNSALLATRVASELATWQRGPGAQIPHAYFRWDLKAPLLAQDGSRTTDFGALPSCVDLSSNWQEALEFWIEGADGHHWYSPMARFDFEIPRFRVEQKLDRDYRYSAELTSLGKTRAQIVFNLNGIVRANEDVIYNLFWRDLNRYDNTPIKSCQTGVVVPAN